MNASLNISISAKLCFLMDRKKREQYNKWETRIDWISELDFYENKTIKEENWWNSWNLVKIINENVSCNKLTAFKINFFPKFLYAFTSIACKYLFCPILAYHFSK